MCVCVCISAHVYVEMLHITDRFEVINLAVVMMEEPLTSLLVV